LTEVVVATFLVGLLLVSALTAVGGLVRLRTAADLRTRAVLLADDLTSEILEHAYVDPDGDAQPHPWAFFGYGPILAPEGAEASGTRAGFDDVDDFHNWNASPPQHRDGTPLVNATGWRRQVRVEYVWAEATNLTTVADRGVKRITVTVFKDGVQLAELVTLRTRQWDEFR
jgi:hypothetical protein